MNVNNANLNAIQRPTRAEDGAIAPNQPTYSSIINMVTKASNTNNTFQSTQSVQRISTWCIYALANRDTSNMTLWESNIRNVSNYLDSESYTRRMHDSLNWSVSKILQFTKNPQLTLDIASKRVKNGEPCDKVAFEHDIKGLAYINLELKAVTGVAGERVRNGENIYKVLDDHSITRDAEAHRALRDIGIRSGHR
ncbi:hypothetical protein Sant_3793 [Sodalis praecaptivus]|uniref:Uncharacterized protein n=1 Tax=Sodalis praecaptivus TaxID=1239307 RepID=W0I1V5_9GAMM|nr:hypothetical protein [Sodalis praecaptivus]AHF78772.1 hypothetical protein Sant_3793 [Sodalis praecaptivus]